MVKEQMAKEQYKFTSDVVIGLEVHIELATETKLFCHCPTHNNHGKDSGIKQSGINEDIPNSRTCPVCLGHPGSKPVLNRKAVDYALMLCHALGCKIAPELVFSRKSYFYPDMSKNYQITQYELPLGEKGSMKLSDSSKIGITRVHMEEDPAAMVHPAGMANSKYVLVDYNRSGDPLCEIVTEPELTSPEQARDFMKKLITIIRYLGIFDINRCIIKADANISVKESRYTRVEIKNITGFKDIEKALNYEIIRQKKDIKEGQMIRAETRAWDSQYGVTRSMRLKETEADYGYIIDPDLVPIEITDDWIKKTKDKMPEMPDDKVKKYMHDFRLAREDAEVITADKELAEMLEAVAKETDPVLAAKWIRRELVRCLNYNKLELSEVDIKPKHIISLLNLIEKKRITDTTGQKIMEKLVIKPFDVEKYVGKEGLEAVSDTADLEKFCDEAIRENPKAVEDFMAGSEKSFNSLVGSVMKKTSGKADPKVVRKIILGKLNS